MTDPRDTPKTDRETHLLCLDCGAPTDVPPGAFLRGCPACGSTSIPADRDDTVTLTITAHELRVLTMWAANWAQKIGHGHVVQGITDRMGTQTAVALTLGQEIADVRAAFPEARIEVRGENGEVIDP